MRVPSLRTTSLVGLGMLAACARDGGEGQGHLHLLEIRWGRIVRVEDVTGTLVGREAVVEEEVVAGLSGASVSTNPVTERTTARIPFPAGTASFEAALAGLRDGLGLVLARREADPPPYSWVPRNAALLLRFDLPVDPASVTPQTIRVLAGGPGGAELEARRFVSAIDPREVAVAVAIPPFDALAAGLPASTFGLPASAGTTSANIRLRIPTRIDASAGQTQVLRSASGGKIDDDPLVAGSAGDGPDLVRVFRSGGPTALTGDPNEGFLLDLDPPEIVGTQAATLISVAPAPGGRQEVEFDFVVPGCSFAPAIGDVLEQGGNAAVVVAVLSASPPRVTVEPDAPGAALATGDGHFHHPYGAADAAMASCFLRFFPAPASAPAGGVDPSAVVRVRFGEPIDPGNVRPFDTVTLTLADPGAAGPAGLAPSSFVVGVIASAQEQREFTFVPTVAIPHAASLAEPRYLSVETGEGGVRDLVGNPLPVPPFRAAFTLDPAAPAADTAGFALRFDDSNETNGSLGLPDAAGKPEVGGQATVEGGVVRGRPVLRFSRVADLGNPFVGVANQFDFPIVTPLSPFGSRLMTLWRHVDLGVSLQSVFEINLDVERLSWVPFLGPASGGSVGSGLAVADQFARFRIDLAHSYYFADEAIDPGSLLPMFWNSGLSGNFFYPSPGSGPPANGGLGGLRNPFAFWGDPQTEAPAGPPRTLYDGPYTINPSSVFLAPGTGTPMMPYPDLEGTYTWRDTGFPYALKGGPYNQGVEPVQWDVVYGLGSRTVFATTGKLPSIALPLLLQFRNYPLDPAGSLGVNGLQISVMANPAVNGGNPAFRLFSSGGVNVAGNLVLADPDSNTATGGFNPGSTPPGIPTMAFGPDLYWGQADFVVRVSRAFTHWFDTGATTAVVYASPVIEPAAAEQPAGTQVIVEFRGSDLVTGPCPLGTNPSGPMSEPLEDASGANPYGVFTTGNPPDAVAAAFPIGGEPCAQVQGVVPPFPSNPSKYQSEWTADLSALNGKRFLQMRLTFLSNIETGEVPALSSLGIAYTR